MNRRRRHWINAGFQGRFLVMIMKLVILTMGLGTLTPLVMALFLYFPNSGMEVGWRLIIPCFAIVAIVATLSLVYMGIRISHKICGPLHRMQNALEAVQRGERPQMLQVRQGDQFQELIETFNETFEAVLAPEQGPKTAEDSSAAQTARDLEETAKLHALDGPAGIPAACRAMG